MMKLREMWNDVKEYLWTLVMFLLILLIIAIPDLIYYYRPAWWGSGVKPLGILCDFVRRKGFSYTGALETLKSNFGILVTAISVFITITVNNLNRSETKVFGLRRSEFYFSNRQLIYKYGRRMVPFAPLAMIFAVIIGFTILGYGIMILCYLFVVVSYFLFESTFSRNKDLACIVRKLHESVAQNAQDREDIIEYRMLLNVMRQWNEKEKNWDDVNDLFCNLCDQAREDNIEKMYILCYCFYEAMYMQHNEKDYDRAVYALKVYMEQRDRQGWTQEDYFVLWGMLSCLFARCDRENLLHLIKWYLDFPVRSRNLGRKYDQDGNGEYNRTIYFQTTRMQTGIFLMGLETYFGYTSYENIDGYILMKLSQIWNEGKYILAEGNKTFRQTYLDINALYDLRTDKVDEQMQNLCLDYQYGTTKSMVAYYLKYE